MLKNKDKIEMLKILIKIRKFEEKTISLSKFAKIWGYLHPYIGEEAIATGVCAALDKTDYIISNHRGHGHSIAKGSDIKFMMAELFGKSTGYCKGRGGSMHIADTEIGMLGANGIVGGGLPLAVGVGLSCKMEAKGRVVVCFFSDGASNNGVFHESLNMSSIFKLPVIYLCENNLYGLSMRYDKSVSCNNIVNRASSYNIPGYSIDGSDPLIVYNTVKKAIKFAREEKGPSLIVATAYRFTGHNANDPALYRDKKEEEYYKKEKDPISNFKKKILEEKILTEKEIEDIENNIMIIIEEAVQYAEKSPEPQIEEFLKEFDSL